MVEVEEGLRLWLLADADVQALAGNRVYPNDKVPQGAGYPRVLIQRSQGSRVRTFDGPTDLAHPIIQLDCVALSYDQAKQLARAVKGTSADRKLDGFAGDLHGVTVQGAHLQDDERDGFRLLTDGSDKGEHIVTLDFEIWHLEG